MLAKLYINNNKITSAAADDIAAVVSCNPYLEEFDISENEIEGRGATNLLKVSKKIHYYKNYLLIIIASLMKQQMILHLLYLITLI